MRLVPIIALVVAVALIVFGRLRRKTPVAIAGYVLLAIAAVLEIYLRSQ